MPFYMTQWNYPAAAAGGMISQPHNREAEARKLMEGFGGKLHQFYFCFGRYDGLAITEFPDDQQMMAALMSVSASGGVQHVETTKLMTGEEAKKSMQVAHTTKTGYQPAGG